MLDFICKMNQIKRCQSFPCFCFNLKKVKSFCSGSWSLARLQDFVIPGQVFFVWVVRVHRCFGPNKMPPSHIQVGHGSHFFIVQAKVPNLNVLDNPTTMKLKKRKYYNVLTLYYLWFWMVFKSRVSMKKIKCVYGAGKTPRK